MSLSNRIRASLAFAGALAVVYVVSRGYVQRKSGDGRGPEKPAAPEPIAVPGVAGSPDFAPAVAAGGLVFLSGAIGTSADDDSSLVEGGAAAETHAAMANVRRTLEAAGLGLEDLAKCTVFLADVEDYDAMNEAYGSYFRNVPPPARSTLAARGLALGAKVQIDCIAQDRR